MTIWTTPEGRGGRDRVASVHTRLIVALAALGLVVVVACEEKHSPAKLSAASSHVTSSPSVVSPGVVSPSVVSHVVTRPSPSSHTTAAVTPHAAPRHTMATTVAVTPSTCGAPANPWGYNFCGRGAYIFTPANDVCSYFRCIANFDNGKGYMVECNDHDYSRSGGRSGACSYHGGVEQAVFSGTGPH